MKIVRGGQNNKGQRKNNKGKDDKKMLASKVVISEETLNKTKINASQAGKLRYQKLVELDSNGEISKATNRKELALLSGYPEESADKRGAQWIGTLIRKGYLTETFSGFGNDGQEMREFHLTSLKPDYDFSRRTRNLRGGKGKLSGEVGVNQKADSKVIGVNENNGGDSNKNEPIIDNLGSVEIVRAGMVIKARLDKSDIAGLVLDLVKTVK